MFNFCINIVECFQFNVHLSVHTNSKAIRVIIIKLSNKHLCVYITLTQFVLITKGVKLQFKEFVHSVLNYLI